MFLTRTPYWKIKQDNRFERAYLYVKSQEVISNKVCQLADFSLQQLIGFYFFSNRKHLENKWVIPIFGRVIYTRNNHVFRSDSLSCYRKIK